MNKKKYLLISLLIVFLLVGCQSMDPSQQTSDAEALASNDQELNIRCFIL